jgi:hypothetical protein
MRKASTKFREKISPRAGSLHLHRPKPKTSAERGRAYRKREREKSAARSAKAAPSPAEPIEKSKTFANGEQPERPVREWPTLPPPPAFAELEKSTAELVAACQRGIEAARLLRGIA